MRRVYCGKIGTEYRYISSPDREVLDPRAHRRRGQRGPAPEGRAQEPARQAHRGRGVRALPRHEVPGPAALLRRGRATRRSRCSTGSSRARRAAGSTRSSIGMSHRGRLNILANVVGNSAERIFSGFEGVVHPDFPADEGDVKYHQGARDHAALRVGPRRGDPGRVQPVAPRGGRPGRRGRRAGQAGADGAGTGPTAWKHALPVLLHGDAAFAGQGMVAEVLNLAQPAGLPHGRHDPRRRQQPDRLHDAALEGRARRSIRRTSRRSTRSRSSTSTPTIPRPRTACSRSRSTTGRSSTRTSSST